MRNMNDRRGFSVMEVLVVVVLLSMLGGIAFLSFEVLMKNNRDKKRIIDLKNIEVWLKNYRLNSSVLPKPYKSKDINFDWEVINYQWYMDKSILNTIWLKNNYSDPLDKNNYTYVINNKRNRFQLLWLLENNWDEKTDLNYKKRLPYTVGDDLWIFLNKVNNNSSNENIDIKNDVSPYILYLNSEEFAVWEQIWKIMAFRVNPTANCLHILKNGNSVWNGIYTISPNSVDSMEVYCDMETDDGWWTLFYANNWIADSKISESYVSMREQAFSGKIYDLTDYNEPTLAGLSDYRQYTDNWAKEVLITNLASNDDKWWRIYFDSSSTLEWALGEKVLWKWIDKCLDLPEWAKWWIINQNWNDSHNNLTQFFTQWWNNWWISHKVVDCNWKKEQSILPHLAFYSANLNTAQGRTRSSAIVWWIAWWENQYRYFIR